MLWHRFRLGDNTEEAATDPRLRQESFLNVLGAEGASKVLAYVPEFGEEALDGGAGSGHWQEVSRHASDCWEQQFVILSTP